MSETGAVAPATGAAQQTAPALAAQNHNSVLYFRIKWPARAGFTAQAIPANAETLEVTVRTSAGIEVASQVLKRPAAGEALERQANIELDPALQNVSVLVAAKDAAGNVLSTGRRDGVVLRDNSRIALTITLDAGLVPKLDLLRNLQNYFARFDHFNDPAEFQAIKDAVSATFGPLASMAPSSNQSPEPTPSPYYSPSTSKYRVQGAVTTQFHNPVNPAIYMDLVGNEIQALHWPGSQLSLAFDGAGATHTLSGALTPEGDGGNGTTAAATLSVSAGAWQADPALSTDLTGLLGDQPATASLTFFGGESPVLSTLQSASVAARLDLLGDPARRYQASAHLEGVQDIANSPLVQALFNTFAYHSPSTTTGQTVTGSGVALASAAFYGPDFQIDLDGQADLVQSHMLATARLRIMDNDKVWETLSATSSVAFGIDPTPSVTKITSVTTDSVVLDEANGLLAHINLVASNDGGIQLQVRFLDSQNGMELGAIDWTGGPSTNMQLISNWPLLRLADGSQYQLTPSVLTGQTSGQLFVEVH